MVPRRRSDSGWMNWGWFGSFQELHMEERGRPPSAPEERRPIARTNEPYSAGSVFQTPTYFFVGPAVAQSGAGGPTIRNGRMPRATMPRTAASSASHDPAG